MNGQGTNSNIIHKVSEWFVAGTALIYASGFIVVYTFLERWGIRETGDQLLRIKYFHVGFLGVLFPLLIAVPVPSIIHLYKGRAKHSFSFLLSASCSFFLGLVLCLILIFASVDYFQRHGATIGWFVFLCFLGVALSMEYPITGPPKAILHKRVYVRREKDIPRFRLYWKNFCAWLNKGWNRFRAGWSQYRFWLAFGFILTCLVLFLWKLLPGLLPTMNLVLVVSKTASAAWLYLLLTALIGYYCWIGWNRAAELHRAGANEEQRKGTFNNLLVVIGARIVAFYFVGLLFFAYGVYPLIPAARGGGSFAESPRATIDVRLTTNVAEPQGIFCPSSNQLSGQDNIPLATNLHFIHARTVPVIPIELTSSSVFVARADDNGGPTKWSEGVLPNVHELPRPTIEFIQYETRFPPSSPRTVGCDSVKPTVPAPMAEPTSVQSTGQRPKPAPSRRNKRPSASPAPQ